MIDRKRLRRPAERLEEPAETLIADDGAFGPDFPFTDRLVVDTLVRAFFIVQVSNRMRRIPAPLRIGSATAGIHSIEPVPQSRIPDNLGAS